MRRVFPRVSQSGGAVIRISATLENSRELLWFLQRFPMDVDRQDLLGERSKQHAETEAHVFDLVMGHIKPDHVEMAIPPREYQAHAGAMVEVVKGLLLADDLGLGKSVSSMCPLTNPKNLPALIVCPAHLPKQWAKFLVNSD